MTAWIDGAGMTRALPYGNAVASALQVEFCGESVKKMRPSPVIAF